MRILGGSGLVGRRNTDESSQSSRLRITESAVVPADVTHVRIEPYITAILCRAFRGRVERKRWLGTKKFSRLVNLRFAILDY